MTGASSECSWWSVIMSPYDRCIKWVLLVISDNVTSWRVHRVSAPGDQWWCHLMAGASSECSWWSVIMSPHDRCIKWVLPMIMSDRIQCCYFASISWHYRWCLPTYFVHCVTLVQQPGDVRKPLKLHGSWLALLLCYFLVCLTSYTVILSCFSS